MPATDNSGMPFSEESRDIAYRASTPGDWSTVPLSVGDALDYAAAGLVGGGIGGSGTSGYIAKFAGASTIGDSLFLQTGTTSVPIFRITGSGANDGDLSYNTVTDVFSFSAPIASPELTTPTIASFANAQHDHEDAAGGGQLDHGSALTGLTDDDHTQYALLAGRAGGQTLQGGTAASDAITIQDNSNVSPSGGEVIFKTDGTWNAKCYGGTNFVVGEDVEDFGRLAVVRSGANCVLGVATFSDTSTHQAIFNVKKARGTSGSPTAVNASGIYLGRFAFQGYTGSAFAGRASIDAITDGACSGTTIPTSLVFNTGSTGLSSRMVIDSAGDFDLTGGGDVTLATASSLQWGSSSTAISYSGGGLAFVATAGSSVQFLHGGSVEMQEQADTLIFNSGGTNPRLDWATASTLNIQSGTTTRIGVDATGLGFFATAPVAQPTVTGVLADGSPLAQSIAAALFALGLAADGTS